MLVDANQHPSLTRDCFEGSETNPVRGVGKQVLPKCKATVENTPVDDVVRSVGENL